MLSRRTARAALASGPMNAANETRGENVAAAGVETALVGMQLLAADLTEFDADGQALLDRLGSVGPPTMIFLDAEGREAPGTRLIGEPDPSAVVASARAVQ